MEDMRDSTAPPQIVKFVRIFVRFHPLLTVTRLIFGVMFLQDWIEEEGSNQWKALKVYFQSTTGALLDPITKKMKNLSEALEVHLHNEVAKGQPKAKLIGKLALFSATFPLPDTEVSAKYDIRGAKNLLLLLIGFDLLSRSKFWSQLKIFHGRCCCVANSTSNFTFFILAIVFTKFYDNSLRSLIIVLCVAVFFLCLLVVLQPQTDLGFFSFIIGVIGSITYNCFQFTLPTWIITSICFMLFSFKSWLDKHWLDLEQDQSLIFTDARAGNTSVFFILSSIFVQIVATIVLSSIVKSSLSDYKIWLIRTIGVVIASVRLHNFYPKDISPPSTNTKRISGLILTVVIVAEAMFWFALSACPLADYKDWLFAIISYVVFCFWLRRYFPKDLSPPCTNTKGLIGMILSLQSVTTYGIVVLAGFEPRLCHRGWLATIIYVVLWWVQLRWSLPKDLLLSTPVDFKALQWWTVVIYSTVSEIISWRMQLSTTRH